MEPSACRAGHRQRGGPDHAGLVIVLLLRKPAPVETGRAELLAASERVERELRREIAESSRGARQEMTHTLATFQDAVASRPEATRTQNTQIDAFAQQLALLQKSLSDTLTTSCRTCRSRTPGASPRCAPRWRRSCPSCSRPTPPSSTRCARRSTRSCRPRWRRGSAKASSRWPSGWSRCTRAWARCSRWRRAWATCSAC
jgi:hypothetical protein